jgi:hypothetical protein
VADSARDSSSMTIRSHSRDETGFLGVFDGITAKGKARIIKADLEHLQGVHSVKVISGAFRIRFDPAMVTEKQFNKAIKTAGFQTRGFHTTA